LDKIEAQQQALGKAQEVIDTQQRAIEAQERLQNLNQQEIVALRSSLAAKTEAESLQRQRAENAERMVEDLRAKLNAARKRNKIWGGIGLGLGLFLGAKL